MSMKCSLSWCNLVDCDVHVYENLDSDWVCIDLGSVVLKLTVDEAKIVFEGLSKLAKRNWKLLSDMNKDYDIEAQIEVIERLGKNRPTTPPKSKPPRYDDIYAEGANRMEAQDWVPEDEDND
jgi:hypothetical protein